MAVSTVARRLTTLSRFFRAAVIGGHMDKAPTEHVSRPKVDPESPALAHSTRPRRGSYSRCRPPLGPS